MRKTEKNRERRPRRFDPTIGCRDTVNGVRRERADCRLLRAGCGPENSVVRRFASRGRRFGDRTRPLPAISAASVPTPFSTPCTHTLCYDASGVVYTGYIRVRACACVYFVRLRDQLPTDRLLQTVCLRPRVRACVR